MEYPESLRVGLLQIGDRSPIAVDEVVALGIDPHVLLQGHAVRERQQTLALDRSQQFAETGVVAEHAGAIGVGSVGPVAVGIETEAADCELVCVSGELAHRHGGECGGGAAQRVISFEHRTAPTSRGLWLWFPLVWLTAAMFT